VFALSSATAFCSFAAQALAFVSLPFLLQRVLGHTQIETGLFLTSWPVLVAIMAPIAGRLSERYEPGILGSIGLALLGIGMTSLVLLPVHANAFDIIWRVALCGCGFGFFQTPNIRAIMSSAPLERSASASSVIAVSRLYGQTTGTGLAALCFSMATFDGPFVALGIGAGFAVVGCVISASRLLANRSIAGGGHHSRSA
jgi:DHA2 family multidrug resistance protein-like MFS transporter